jgi:ABC-type lipoprotein export system ATPase subunit
MNILSNITIEGFWGSRKLSIQLHPDVNFLIGVNGSGKTTLINIVAAVLSADSQALERLQFEKITLQLAEIGGSRKPSIEVDKINSDSSSFTNLKYAIKEKASGEPVVYSLGGIEEELAFQGIREGYTSRYYRRLHFSQINVVENIKKLINFNWLSVHRYETSRLIREERNYESTVDRKLDELSHEFIKYLSKLAKRGESEINNFQKAVFISLIPSLSDNHELFLVKKLDIEKEKQALIDIFKTFQVEEEVFANNLVKYFNTLDSAVKKLRATSSEFTTSELAAMVSANRIHYAVQEWTKLVELQEKLYESKNIFLEIINSMLQRKHLEFNDKNELIAITQSGKKIQLKELSSGEKQLLIILGSALLQEQTPWIYIADEPELSLHVEWQGKLITNLRRINPKAQILFATHSPDIVSIYGDRIFDMEKILA